VAPCLALSDADLVLRHKLQGDQQEPNRSKPNQLWK
jgi:hypothetical protein